MFLSPFGAAVGGGHNEAVSELLDDVMSAAWPPRKDPFFRLGSWEGIA